LGCEGGFSSDEINLFYKEDIVGFKTISILKVQTRQVIGWARLRPFLKIILTSLNFPKTFP